MHARPGGCDEDAARVRLLPEGSGLVGGIDLFEVVHPDDLDVGAGGYQLEAVEGLASAKRPQRGAEAQEEFGGLHAGPLGRDEVAELVEEDHHGDAEDDQRRVDAEFAAEDERTDDEHDERQRVRLGPIVDDDLVGFVRVVRPGLDLVGALLRFDHAALRSMIARAQSRAAASAASTASTLSAAEPGQRSSAADNTSAIDVHRMRPFKNASTATSLAALSHAGAVSPDRPA